MDFSEHDLGFLAQETMRISSNLSEFDPSLLHQFENDLTPIFSELPETAGVVYKIEKGNATFCIRGVGTTNIKATLSDSGLDTFVRGKLRIGPSERPNPHEVKFFETNDPQNAFLIEEQILNKRFPIFEEVMCNISDPGFSWWFQGNETSLRLFYKSFGQVNNQEMIRLGPLGYSRQLIKSLASFRSILEKMFSIDVFYGDEKSLEISIPIANSNFSLFKDIFLKGVMPFRSEQFQKSDELRSFYETFSAIADLRSFWVEVENQLTSSNSERKILH